jgi:hypothetical protein
MSHELVYSLQQDIPSSKLQTSEEVISVLKRENQFLPKEKWESA